VHAKWFSGVAADWQHTHGIAGCAAGILHRNPPLEPNDNPAEFIPCAQWDMNFPE
jgi:hypothetical protein